MIIVSKGLFFCQYEILNVLWYIRNWFVSAATIGCVSRNIDMNGRLCLTAFYLLVMGGELSYQQVVNNGVGRDFILFWWRLKTIFEVLIVDNLYGGEIGDFCDGAILETMGNFWWCVGGARSLLPVKSGVSGAEICPR